MTGLRIYVAGPYTAPTPELVEANVQRAIDAGIAILKKGHVPYIPHLTHWMELRNQELHLGLTYEDYIHLDDEWLFTCMGILYLAPSPGADHELDKAREWGLTIFLSLDEIP